MRHCFAFILLLFLPTIACALNVPPSPAPHYVIDRAGVLSSAAFSQIDEKLEVNERASSNRIIVAIYPSMAACAGTSEAPDMARYAREIYNAWQIGTSGANNGLLLIAFIDDRRLNITTGENMQKILPDSTCKSIIDNEITPRFKAGDYDGGIISGVNAILAATRGEYMAARRNQFDFSLITGLPFYVWLIAGLLLAVLVTHLKYGSAFSRKLHVPAWTIPLLSLALLVSLVLSLFSWLSSNSRDDFTGHGGSPGGGSSGGGGASGSW